MTELSDAVFTRLRETLDRPDLAGTRYTFEREIGRGGMGAVYAVQDQSLNRRVALKVMTLPGEADRLFAEARVAAALEHPGVMPLYDIGTLPDGRPYYTMKLVAGAHLDDYARGHPALAERLRVFQKLCEAMAFAHSRGVVHRDLKPANIMVGPFGEVLIMDWGVDVAGTRRYRAPEQAAAGSPSADAPAVDVHALGVILGGLLPPANARALAAVAARAVSPNPADRYPDAGFLEREIRRFLDTDTVEAYHEPLLERAGRFYRSNQPLLVLLLVYVIVRFAVFLWPR